ncbi:MAG: E3 binding domain-containing protein, partial [Anaerolineae bacterium]|nr:E3 binding domain-containing protein [Anaerolineae bacterium]
MPTQILMPQLGESVVEGTISRWLKQVGDPIAEFEPLLEVSTDKVETEIPAPAAGVLLSIQVQAGETVAKGTLLGVIGAADELHAETTRVTAQVDDNTQPMRAVHTAAAHSGNGGWHVTPVVARMAAEHSIDLAQIPGSGRGGRVTKKDVEAYLDSRAAPSQAAPAADTPAPWETPGSGDLFKPTDELVSAPPAARPAPPVEATPKVSDAEGELVGLSLMRK